MAGAAEVIPKIFEGRTVAIIAGGPSLKALRWSRLERATTVAINRAHEVLPFASLLWWGDAPFFRPNVDALHAHPCYYKATMRQGYQKGEIPPWVFSYECTGREGFDPDPNCIRSGNNSAYAAMHVVAHQNPARIVLFGVDMQHGPGGETHWHSGHGIVHEEYTLTEKMRPLFAGLVKPLAHRGIEVINASPESALNCWPRCSIDEGVEIVTGSY